MKTLATASILALATLSPLLADSALDNTRLGAAWAEQRFVKTPAPCLKNEELVAQLRRLAEKHPKTLTLEQVGESVMGRPIYLLTLGRGPQKVMLWSQMHGDEPSATPALLDLADYLLRHDDDDGVEKLLDDFTLLMVPMLNPDGAEVYSRRNAQAIDINRDALNLATPEGRLLKELRDRYEPMLGFNLHDQNRRRTVGDTDVLASNAVLAVVGDKAKTLTPGRILTKRASVAIGAALEPFAPGGLARYDDTFSSRSFGDNLTAWGTPVVLIESGGVKPDVSLEELTRLNFIALGAVLGKLAENGLADYDPAAYDAIPPNNIDAWTDVVLRGGVIRQPGSKSAYRADIAFNHRRGDREAMGCSPKPAPRSDITEVGDARVFGSSRVIDAKNAVLVAPFIVGAQGWAVHTWLDAKALDTLARLGVAELRWWVPLRRLGAARQQVAKLAGLGRPRVEVLADEAELPPLRLARRPQPPADATLGARFAALAAAAGQPPAAIDAALAALWPDRRPTLTLDAAASFLMARPAPLAATSKVELIFLDGVEVSP